MRISYHVQAADASCLWAGHSAKLSHGKPANGLIAVKK
jgi:hypothetical protein